MTSIEKTISEFVQDPEHYLNRSYKNANQMPTYKKITTAINSTILGIGTGLCTFGLSVFTGSNRGVAVTAAFTIGTLIVGANCIYQAHEYGLVNRTKDIVNENTNSIKKELSKITGL